MLLSLLLLGFAIGTHAQCVDINTPSMDSIIGSPYDSGCYNHVVSEFDCCEHFLFDKQCTNLYRECIDYKNLKLYGFIHDCDGHNDTILNLSYSNNCHNFTLQLNPSCCDNMTNPECFD